NLMMNLKNHGSLKGVFVLSDGLNVNGSELTRGINSILSKYENVVATGALAGDNDNFESTWVIADGSMRENVVTAVGFYGENIYLGSGSQGGWDRFGIDHKVTRSEGNVLYTLDEKPALDLYKRYLGEYAKDLPSSGLLFPLQVKVAGEKPKVRTILSIDEKRRSITFAGDIEEGSSASFMKANFDNLISGAEQAAMQIDQNGYGLEDALLIAVSCVGRRLVLGQRSEDELEVVRDIFPLQVKMVGFYSYGEISTQDSGRCDLLNQTMTLTWLRERCR
ncbi:MAG: FIST C-terminal domain-containing protein, partial [Hydrogenimonas sp.]|nr:FIST C-terminal domain-containing protein [Hydrogenimonas sp.]